MQGEQLTREPFSAASGLVRHGQTLYVVADDSVFLAQFSLDFKQPGQLLRLLPSEMPADTAQRKRVKPDVESLVLLPAFGRYPFGLLMALGSGSGSQRFVAACVGVDAQGRPHAPVLEVNLARLYAPLSARYASLNIEGAFVCGDKFCLLQRGHSAEPVNAMISFSLLEICAWLLAPETAAPIPLSFQAFDLGVIDHTPLCFTDGTGLPGGGWAFCAAAEDTADSYNDGICKGSAIGIVSAEGCLESVQVLNLVCKAEGIALMRDTSSSEFLLVTDADDPGVPAQVLSVSLLN